MLSAEKTPGIVDLDEQRERRQQAVWQRYTDARAAAERSGNIDDGIAAGHAWRAWLDTFQSTSQLEADREFERVIQLRRRSSAS